jgi:stress response protein YsnF
VVSLTHDSRPVNPIQASDLFVPKRALVICIVAFAERTATGEVDQDYRIELRGEVLQTFKERIQRGEVPLRKEVVTENKTVEVPVTSSKPYGLLDEG